MSEESKLQGAEDKVNQAHAELEDAIQECEAGQPKGDRFQLLEETAETALEEYEEMAAALETEGEALLDLAAFAREHLCDLLRRHEALGDRLDALVYADYCLAKAASETRGTPEEVT